ncbi:MAG: VIT1/CCC1 transporter family protein [Spirochaetales bacterium]|nr:VIT1/CCC1 transporter family protein [Spirochaetales bacterium]
MQRNEITEYHIYLKIARTIKDEANKKILTEIAEDEHRHYHKLLKITQKEVKPNRVKIWFYYLISIVLGLSFGLKLMEKGESLASSLYDSDSFGDIELKSLSLDEQRHEKSLLNILSEERLEYAGSIVLGLNDALVELTGALAGLTFALQNNKQIALAGLVTGFAASLSMAASGYLSSKEEAGENGGKNPLKAALYTGITYVITVILLIFPFFVFLTNPFIALGVTLAIALVIIFLYTFYITTAKGLKFFRRFTEMAVISLVVAVISFFAGLGLKIFLGIDA